MTNDEIEALAAMDEQEENHHFDAFEDRCSCGAEIVYLEGGDKNGDLGYGCELIETVDPSPRVRRNGR